MLTLTRFVFIVGILAVVVLTTGAVSTKPNLVFPLQFSASLTITSHLIEESSEYPPKRRFMTVYYDYINKKARADIEAGYEAAKVYYRRYDQKNEYMVRLQPINDCKRSYLGEVMPFPDIDDVEYVGVENVEGTDCNHFVHEDYDTQVHMYMAVDSGAPVRLVQVNTDAKSADVTNDGNSESGGQALLTYDYTDVQLGAPDDSLFELPEAYDHKSCVRHVGGFPYLHIFHYFVRF